MTIRTRSVREGGIRRCGVRHVGEWTDWPEKQFTKAEIERMREDPDVVVEEVAGSIDSDIARAAAKKEAEEKAAAERAAKEAAAEKKAADEAPAQKTGGDSKQPNESETK